ncbi:MAG: hydrogenase iron-sulfur subunit [Proteobacteria bacterium]|nr:hydrogenase iron-sulfur subunit [Pseudomonadota bacterium]
MNQTGQSSVENTEFKPTIIAFCCRWCSYAAADLAGSMRLQYPSTIRIVQVPCTGRVDALHVLGAFQSGADGVFISGCLPGDCHYLTGNYKCAKRVAALKKTLEEIGLGEGRLEMYYNSAAMGPQFAQTCIDFNRRIKDLGPWRTGGPAA